MELTQQHLVAIEMLLKGSTGRDVARHFGLTEQGVSYWRRQPEFKAEYERLRQEIFAETKENVVNALQEAAPKAVSKVIQLMEHADSDKTQLSAACDILDRAGFAPVEKKMVAASLQFDSEFVHFLKGLFAEDDRARSHATGRGPAVIEAKVSG